MDARCAGGWRLRAGGSPGKQGFYCYYLFVFLYATVEIAVFSPPRGYPQLGELQVSHAVGSDGEGHCGPYAVFSAAPCGWLSGITVYVFL